MKTTPFEPVRCVVVGLGEMGRLHAAALAATPLAELAAVCDTSPRAIEQRPVPAPAFASLEAALEQTPSLEAAIVCTPPDRHLEPVRQAMDAGLQVLCEKPLATSRHDADALLELADAAPGRLAVGHLRRFDPRFIALAQAIEQGRIGRPIEMSAGITCPRADARRLAASVSLALELAIHDLDAIRWLGGARVERVHAEALDVFPTAGPDALVATARLESGAVASLHESWAMADEVAIDWEFRFRVVGTTGVAEIDGRDRGVTVFDAGRSAPMHPDTMLWPSGSGGAATGALESELRHFLQHVRDGRPWPVSVGEAREAVLAALALDRSLAAGAPVDVEI